MGKAESGEMKRRGVSSQPDIQDGTMCRRCPRGLRYIICV